MICKKTKKNTQAIIITSSRTCHINSQDNYRGEQNEMRRSRNCNLVSYYFHIIQMTVFQYGKI